MVVKKQRHDQEYFQFQDLQKLPSAGVINGTKHERPGVGMFTRVQLRFSSADPQSRVLQPGFTGVLHWCGDTGGHKGSIQGRKSS